MMLESGYQEPLYIQEGHSLTRSMQESIPALLRANHGVGIVGGYYEKGLPICFISELAVKMLGYGSSAEFEAATGNAMSALLYQNKFSADQFVCLTDSEETHLRAKNGALWVRIVKRDVVEGDEKMWLISVCDMDALYQKEVLVNQIMFEKRRQEILQEEELRKANVLLEEQKTELQAAYAAAQKANDAKSDFLARISHDIRVPINSIVGLLEVASHFASDTEKLASLHEKCRMAAWYLLSLVNDVLDMSKLESGDIHIVDAPFRLDDLLNQCREIIMPQAEERGLTAAFENRVCGKDCALIGSSTHLRQILMNLFSNAVKYNRPQGSITAVAEAVSADETSVTVRFTVADTGRGMSREYQKHMFEPFTRDPAHAATVNGTGLGLSIVKRLTELLGGNIEVESEEGAGTSFTLVIPFRRDTGVNAAESRLGARRESLRGLNVLVVEDNELNMEVTKFLLENEGCIVREAVNGEEAVRIFGESKPFEFDVILMDVMIPIMNGYEATHAIRTMDRADAQKVQIVAMTGNAFSEDVKKCRDAGMDTFLAKPFKAEQLLAAVSGVS